MQTHRQATFLTTHIRMLALALLLLVATAALLLTAIIASGDNKRGDVIRPAAQPEVLRPSVGGLDAGVTTSVGITTPAGQRSWGLGVGFDAGLVDAATTSAPKVRQLPGLGIGFDPGLTSSPAIPQLPGDGIGPTEH